GTRIRTVMFGANAHSTDPAMNRLSAVMIIARRPYMSLSVPNTGATAVDARRYAVMTQDRLETSRNWRPMVGSAVATMVWSSAARNIATIRLNRMARTSSGVSGARGARGGASVIAITWVGSSGSSVSISSAREWDSAGKRLCRSN